MKLPIALALSWPERLPGVARPCDWSTAASWTFEPLDQEAFPAVELARTAGRVGGTAPAVFNAANEICVDAFHDGRIGFLQILDIVNEVVDQHVTPRPSTGSGLVDEGSGPEADVGSKLVVSGDLTLEVVLAADAWARRRATELIETGHRR